MLVLFQEKEKHVFLYKNIYEIKKNIHCCRFAIPEIWNIPEKWLVWLIVTQVRKEFTLQLVIINYHVEVTN